MGWMERGEDNGENGKGEKWVERRRPSYSPAAHFTKSQRQRQRQRQRSQVQTDDADETDVSVNVSCVLWRVMGRTKTVHALIVVNDHSQDSGDGDGICS